MQALAINYVHGEAEVDNDGNLLRANVNGSVTITDIFGQENSIEVTADASFTDIGTSNAECPIGGAEQLLTPDYMKNNFGNEYMSVFFTVNQDGSINADSVTTKYPGEGMRKAPLTLRNELGTYSDVLTIEGSEAVVVVEESENGVEVELTVPDNESDEVVAED